MDIRWRAQYFTLNQELFDLRNLSKQLLSRLYQDNLCSELTALKFCNS
jgi:hypothetical protein